MILARDYNQIFKDKFVVVSGMPRSGTTLLGKIIGSLENCYYIYEPNIFILIPPLIQMEHLSKQEGRQLLQAALFEDLFANLIQGRYVNFREDDLSFIGNYKKIEDVKSNWNKLKTERDTLNYLETSDCKFIIKMPNCQPYLTLINDLFHGAKFIDITRNGYDVIGSCIRRNFFSDEFMSSRSLYWSTIVNNKKIPWFIYDKYKFSLFNQTTRIAHIWRLMQEYILDFNKPNLMTIKFEDLKRDREYTLSEIEKFVGLKRTDITEYHMKSIDSHSQIIYPIPKDIDKDEYEVFMYHMRRLGYES